MAKGYALRGRHGSGNVVDGPALAWLARQPRPRIWFCDGAVTGIGDHGDLRCTADAERPQRNGSIRRLDELQAVYRAFGVVQA